MYSHTYTVARVWINRVRVANPARGQLNRENEYTSAFAPENLVSRDGFGSPVPRQPAHLHTQAESGAYLRDSSRVPRRRPFICFKPPYAIGSVPSLSGHAIIIAYRWRSLPRVRRHRANKPQRSSERVLPWQVNMDQLICVSLSRTHQWHEVGMLKVPAIQLNGGINMFTMKQYNWPITEVHPSYNMLQRIPLQVCVVIPLTSTDTFTTCTSFARAYLFFKVFKKL